MIVLGIDPGIRNTGYAILGDGKLIDYGAIVSNMDDYILCSKQIYSYIRALFNRHRIHYIVYEEAYSQGLGGRGTNFANYVIGALSSLASEYQCGICGINPTQIKKHMLQSYDTKNKRWAINLAKALYPELDTNNDHTCDAVLLATYWLQLNIFIGDK